jgi:carbon monoxide dehydrogenase subunit G
MKLEDRFTIQAPVEQVWETLADLPRVSRCIPGAQEVRAIAPDRYEGHIQVKVGPLGAAFRGQVQVLERTPASRLALKITGDDKGSGSSVAAVFSAEFTPVGGGTQVAYQVDYSLRGRLGTFGSAVLQGTVRKLTAEFVACLQEMIANDSGEE